jgi:cobalamin-dependent methionine synthase I
MANALPIKLDGRVTLRGTKLLFTIHSAVFSLRLAEEAAEWIWQEVIGNGNRRDEHEVSPVALTLTDKGIQIAIGAGDQKYPLFHTLQPHRRGLLLDRQTASNAGKAGLWTVVEL